MRKWLFAILCVCVLMSISACGENKEDNSSNPTQSSSQSSSQSASQSSSNGDVELPEDKFD